MKVTALSHGRIKAYPAGSLLGKIQRRGIIGALATFAGSGWLLYEIVHFILVEHYHLPDRLKDIAIMSVLCAALCNLTWRWFRGEQKPRKPKWELILIPIFILAAAVINITYALHLNVHEPDPYGKMIGEIKWKNALAVLPFINMSSDKEQEYFCDGLTEEMITKLSQIRELKVTARTSAFAFKGENRDIREVGRKLGVDKILEGSVRKEGARLRISAQLINTADGFHVWSESYDRDLDKVFRIQDDIALSVAGALKITLFEKEGSRSQTQNIEAYDEFLLGRNDFVNSTKDNLEKAIRHFERAVELDPGYARAWAILGAAVALQANIGFAPIERNRQKAVAAIDRALQLDDRLAYAHSVMGWIRMTFDWDWAGADAAFKKALSLNPGTGLHNAAQLALALGRFESALALARRAVELDSLNATAQMNLAVTAFYAGRLEEAAAVFAKLLQLSPERANVNALLGQVYLAQSLPEKALAAAEKERDPLFRLPVLAMAYRALGREKEAYKALGELIENCREGGAYQIAQVFAFIGEADQAFEWLEIAYNQRDGGLYLTWADPFLKPLRRDPRFAAFLKKLHFPPDLPQGR